MSQWTHDGDGLRCLAHDVAFSALEVCPHPDCAPRPIVSEIDGPIILPAPPPGCASSEEIERRMLAIADQALTSAEMILNDGDSWHRYGAATKFYEVSIKALRAAGGYAREREGEYIVAEREKRLAKIRRRAAH